MDLKLVIFDVDGTLIDSQAHIMMAIEAAFKAHDLPVPARSDVLSGVGLSLPLLMARLVPDQADLADSLSDAYKASFQRERIDGRGDALSPLYPGAQAAMDALRARDDVVLGIATGKSKRGLDHLVKLHGWDGLFQTVQVADFHPSKPHPSMVEACLAETGLEGPQAMMVGDTTFDMEMAVAAGVQPLGVSWGYHSENQLWEAGAKGVLRHFDDLMPALSKFWGDA